jgi:predicted ATPase/class 3 adenylate cyclase/DNA-binding CsgD family transcriptional regulator
MSELRADTSVNWEDLGVSGLPTGTVTLLLADVEGSTRLWESQPEAMTAAIAALDNTLTDLVAAHDGVRPVEQGEGDSFVVAFARASDAVACALALQRAPLAPIQLRIGVNTGEIQLRDEGNYIGPTINRTARLRDLGHGGQTVLSGATEAMVVDRLPDDAWLSELGTHPLRDLPRPERVVQLCHPDIRNEFPPLRTAKTAAEQNLPHQLTSFIGRDEEMTEVQTILEENRFVTLTGAGGAGKTRLALEVAGAVTGDFRDGVFYVDLAPITHPDLVPLTAARALGLPDQPGRSSTESLVRFVGDLQLLIVMDNCEHLLDACAALIGALLSACPSLTLLATSREPIGMPGELTWRVPSLSLDRGAVELFADRARKVRADFKVTEDNSAAVAEICRRLDGMPLAIELAAARVRALSVKEIVDSLHDRFRLLTGGARTSVRRQQTLRASVDWSHALLTEPERILFRRLAAFMGGFDLDAAEVVGGGGEVERYQVLDQLTLLVDKSLVVAESATEPTRYRLLETVRQYALEKLGESGEAGTVRTRHRDHYTAMAALLDSPSGELHEVRLAQAALEIDNLRAAFQWSRENADIEHAMMLATSLQALWLARGRIQEGVAALEIALAERNEPNADVSPAVYARALADKAMLDSWLGTDSAQLAETALEIARGLDDPALLSRTLTAYGCVNGHNGFAAKPYFAEALELARVTGDAWRISQILGWQSYSANMMGDPATARAVAIEGRDFAEEIGDSFVARQCRWSLGLAMMWHGELAGAVAQLDEVAAEAEFSHDLFWSGMNRTSQAYALAYQGCTSEAARVAEKALEPATEVRAPILLGYVYSGLSLAALSDGDVERADEFHRLAMPLLIGHETAPMYGERAAQIALARGDVAEARRSADEAVAATADRPYHAMLALTASVRVAMADGRPELAEDHAHAALAHGVRVAAYLGVPDILECLAGLAGRADSHPEAARLFGGADAIRKRSGETRFKIYDSDYETSVASVREALGDSDFDTAWSEGAALTIQEAIAYAQRGRGERKRPSSGWASLTPAEIDVVRLVSEGLANKDIATRLFISPRTVQTHLTHVYTKLNLTSRVQLAQEAGRHG